MQFLPKFIRQKLEGKSNLRKIIGNTGWLFADRFLRIIVELFIGVWIARYLGPEKFGLYSYAIAFVALFSAFSTLGLDRIVVREIVKEPTDKDEIIGTAFILKFIGGILGLLSAFGIIQTSPD